MIDGFSEERGVGWGKDGLRHEQYEAGENLADFGEDRSGPWSLGSGKGGQFGGCGCATPSTLPWVRKSRHGDMVPSPHLLSSHWLPGQGGLCLSQDSIQPHPLHHQVSGMVS